MFQVSVKSTISLLASKRCGRRPLRFSLSLHPFQVRSLSSSLEGPPTHAYFPPEKCQFSEEFLSVPLLERQTVSPTSSLLRFGLPNPDEPLKLSTCACLLVSTEIGNKTITRPYTPVSTNATIGSFQLLVKDYSPNGTMSTHLCQTMDVGDTIDVKHIPFNVKIQYPEMSHAKRIIMLCGGSGITPMIQALHSILGDPDNNQCVTMVYGSQVSSDILAEPLLEEWRRAHSDRFQLHHILSSEPDSSKWGGDRGLMTKEYLEQTLSTKNGDDLVFVCGPPKMYDVLCGARDDKTLPDDSILSKLGYSIDQVYKF